MTCQLRVHCRPRHSSSGTHRADAVVPPDGSPPYVLVRVELDPHTLELVPEVQLVAGMPTELYILGTPRTARY